MKSIVTGIESSVHSANSSQMREALWQPTPKSVPSNQAVLSEEQDVSEPVTNPKLVRFSNDPNSKIILIRGGQVVNSDATVNADVLIDNGIISQLGTDIPVPEDAYVIDATDKFVIPGGIDGATHLHCPQFGGNGPYPSDGFYTGTKAAIAGGTTLVVDVIVPSTNACSSLLEAFLKWKDDAQENSCCNFTCTMSVPSKYIKSCHYDMERLITDEGVNSFKVFMAYQNNGLMLKSSEILHVMDKAKEIGAVVHMHAEDGSIIHENEKRLLAKGITGPEGHELSRPEEVEEQAVILACSLAVDAGVPMVICAPTGPYSVAIVDKYASYGSIWAEVSAASLAVSGHHLMNSCWGHAAGFITSPPLRSDPLAQEKLLENIIQGSVRSVTSENCSYSNIDKIKAPNSLDDFTAIPIGVNGIEDRMSIVWEKGVATGKISKEKFVAVTSTNIAKCLGIYPAKGYIGAGSDADIVVWNPSKLRSISANTHSQITDFTIFEGMKVQGTPEFVICNGCIVVHEYELRTVSGFGKFVSTPKFPSAAYDNLKHSQNNDIIKVNRALNNNKSTGTNSVGHNSMLKKKMISVQDLNRDAQAPTLNPKLGVYQRPLSCHGVRNQQDTTFSLSGGTNELKKSIKVNAPPGGTNNKGSFY